jgi:uncharacterized protein (TIGR02231 family)
LHEPLIINSSILVVQNATWSAAYELHATADAGVASSSVSLHYRARITQSTGENWTGVALTLSTADMNLSTQIIPALIPTKIRPPKNLFDGIHQNALSQPQLPLARSVRWGSQQPLKQPEFGPANSEFGTFKQSAPAASSAQPQVVPQSLKVPAPTTSGLSADNVWKAVAAMAKNDPMPVAEPTTVVHESPLALTYRVEGASRVPSDGVPHQLTVAVLPFAATLEHIAVPKASPVAYLHATVRNTSDYRLLTGPVHAFVDDAFAARTALPGDVAPGDTFHCTLGADPATRIRYTRTARRADVSANAPRAFSEQWASTEYVSCTTITNSHPFALRALVLRDSVPVSEDGERVNVVLRRPAGLADLEQGEELEVGTDGEAAEEEGGEGEGEEGEARPERSKVRRIVRWCKSAVGKGGRKEGMFEWVVDVGAGEEVTIKTEWDVKAPVSLKWVESV